MACCLLQGCGIVGLVDKSSKKVIDTKRLLNYFQANYAYTIPVTAA